MVSLLPTGASFEERVQDCFLAVRGNGLTLSHLDTELLTQWATLEVPFEVVARGIHRAAEACLWDAVPGSPPLRSLRACKRHVDAEVRKHLRLTAGRGRPLGEEPGAPPPVPPHLVRDEKLKAALRKLGKRNETLAGTVARMLNTWLRVPPADVADGARREDRVTLALLRGLPFEARRSVLEEARVLQAQVRPLSARARRESRRFHRAAVLRRRLELPAFW